VRGSRSESGSSSAGHFRFPLTLTLSRRERGQNGRVRGAFSTEWSVAGSRFTQPASPAPRALRFILVVQRLEILAIRLRNIGSEKPALSK